ncbi:hypothetical protein GIY30_03175 [Gordonia sp. HNM0687]|uniref:Uncharacterized protein n=1 Tax=Gordonia mangrovi TaxID=2665643 RepID=A0A6L7GLQ5_9ACTN|nr:hypothetical protein [Gordonia mangrovi]MXP20357.1 hypothetical protein [Gordonia mangrovi]UVF79042.1 hypothetical protein NWF22_04075 [Gordonia mangrovi]
MRVDIDTHGNEVAAVAEAASIAQSEVQAVKARLEEVRAFAAANGLVIDDSTGTVDLPAWEIGTMNVDRANDVDVAQTMVNSVMAAADDADRDLAMAIQAASGIVAPESVQVDGAPLPQAEAADHLPGREYTPDQLVTMGPTAKTSSVRVLPVQVPKGWNDPHMTSDLARRFAKSVTIDPTAKGSVGGLSADQMPANPITGEGVGVPVKGDSVNFDVTDKKQVRVVGAEPASVGSVEVNGVTYLAVTYDYQYEVSDVRTAGVDGLMLPLDNAPNWHSVSRDEIHALVEKGVPLPDPGAVK